MYFSDLSVLQLKPVLEKQIMYVRGIDKQGQSLRKLSDLVCANPKYLFT